MTTTAARFANDTTHDLDTSEKLDHIAYVVTSIREAGETADLLAGDIHAGHYLVGARSLVRVTADPEESDAMPGMLVVDTEVGPVYLDPDERYEVLTD